MTDYNSVLEYFIDNFKKIFYPEEWLAFDLSLSKTELFGMLLIDRQGEIIMSQLADYINVPMSTATGIIERLVKNGYLDRGRSDSDRRIVVVRLTPKGKEFIDGFKKMVLEYIRLVFEAITEEERAAVFSVFTKVLSLLNEKNRKKGGEDAPQSQVRKIEIE